MFEVVSKLTQKKISKRRIYAEITIYIFICRRTLGLDDVDDDDDVPMAPATSSTPVVDKPEKEEKDKVKIKS